MKKLGSILAFIPASVFAIDIEIGVGIAHYTPRGDMMWFQKGLPHKLDLNALSLELGVVGNVVTYGRWDLDLHADYVYLGNVHTDARATADHNYSRDTQSCIGECLYKNRFVGNGHTQGIKLMLDPGYTWNGWRLGVQGGAMAYIHTWNVNVWNQDGVFLSNNSSDHRVRFAPVIGASIGRGNFSLTYTHYFNKPYADPMYSFWKATDTITLRYRF